ncbi:MAG TPA: RNA polymerase sigma-70 factor [Gammaproteobacteria bacterium]
MHPRTDTFGAHRNRLFRLAYRMLGSRADAEDVLQDAWLRWQGRSAEPLQSEEAWLVTVVTRLAIDRLRRVKAERESYPGLWLPEPLVDEEDGAVTPEAAAELADDVSMALLLVLERLAPEERAAFLLRQTFEYDYADIAAMLGKTEAACRKAVQRATERVQQERPRFRVDPERHRALLQRFIAAARSGDRGAIQALLADGVQLTSDGGGKVPSIPRVLEGSGRIANLYWAAQRRLGERVAYRIANVNGAPGLLRFIDGRLESAQAIVTDGERVVAIYVVRNPDKLRAIAIPAA